MIWIGSSYEVVYMSTVRLLIKFVMHVNIKNGQHNHKAIVAANIVCACMQHRKHVSTLHV